MRPPKKHLSFGSLRHAMSRRVRNFPDYREVHKRDYEIHDVVMSGQGMMFFQDRSILQFQEHLQESSHCNNLKLLFNVTHIPKDTQMRSVMDRVESENFRPVFSDFFFRLQRSKVLEGFQLFPGEYLCSVDGSQYFASGEIQCPKCLTKEHRAGHTSYEHQILQAALMHPDQRQVIPLMPEEIGNTDGTEKQDCELGRMQAADYQDPKGPPATWNHS